MMWLLVHLSLLACTFALQLDLEPKTPVPLGNRIRLHCAADISKLNEVWALQFILSGHPEDSFHAMKPLNGLPLIYLPSSGYPERIEELPSEKGNLLFEHGNATELQLSFPVRKSSNGSLASCQSLQYRNNKHTTIEKREIVVTWEPSVEILRHVNDSFSHQTHNFEVTENQMLIVLCRANLGSPPSPLSAIKLKLNGTDVPRSKPECLEGSDHDQSAEKTALCEYHVVAKRAMNGSQLFCVVNETHQSTTAYLTVKAIAPPQELRLLVTDFACGYLLRRIPVNFSVPEPVTVSHVLNKLKSVCGRIERIRRNYRFPVDGTNKTVYEVQKAKNSEEETMYVSEEGQLFALTALSPPESKSLQLKDKFVNVKGYWNIIEIFTSL